MKDKRNCHGALVNHFRNNIYLNLLPLLLLCEISGALLQGGWEAGRLADDMAMHLNI